MPLLAEDNTVGFKSVVDPAMPVELLSQDAELESYLARLLLIDLIEVSYGLALDVLEDYV
jgi:hypothetical protein